MTTNDPLPPMPPDVARAVACLPELTHAAVLCALGEERRDDARVLLDALTAIVEPEPRALLELGKLWLACGDGDRALASIDAALALEPWLADACFARGLVLEIAAGPRLDAAVVAAYQAALRVAPNHWRAAVNLAGVWVEHGPDERLDEVERLLDRAERYGPGPTALLLRTRANLHARRGDEDAAAWLRATAARLDA